jgi:16S rRNA (guanine527-N7)-methyltransferase
MSLAAELAQGVATLGLALDEGARQKLLDYVALVEKWNGTYNLTAVREPQKMLTHHVLDCLAIVPHIRGPLVVDVGSGGGFPGIPLAVADAGKSVTLIDSSHKKTAFLRQAAIELGLSNVTVVCDRVETWRPEHGFDSVVSRAFSDLPELMLLAGHLCAPGGMIAAMKGVHPYEELTQLPDGYRLRSVLPLQVPGLRAARHLVLIDPD